MPEVFGPANAATVDVLARNGFEVEIPSDAGLLRRAAPALGRSRRPPTGCTRRTAARSSSTGVDAVIVNSAGCGATLKDVGDALGRKVRDAAEFLIDAGLREPPHALPLRVAYDDPCHLLHAQRVAAAPRALLRAIPELELFDLPGCRDCCGAAGIYNLTHPEMAATPARAQGPGAPRHRSAGARDRESRLPHADRRRRARGGAADRGPAPARAARARLRR